MKNTCAPRKNAWGTTCISTNKSLFKFSNKVICQVSFEFVSGLFPRFYRQIARYPPYKIRKTFSELFPRFYRQIARYPPYKIRKTFSETILKIDQSKIQTSSKPSILSFPPAWIQLPCRGKGRKTTKKIASPVKKARKCRISPNKSLTLQTGIGEVYLLSNKTI